MRHVTQGSQLMFYQIAHSKLTYHPKSKQVIQPSSETGKGQESSHGRLLPFIFPQKLRKPNFGTGNSRRLQGKLQRY